MTWCIAVDSSCNLRSYQPITPGVSFALAPLKINVAGREYIDDDSLDVAELNRTVANESVASSSSCPSAGEWADIFRSADQVLAITISSNLSGSYEAAMMARNIVLDEYTREHEGLISGKDIFVLDSHAAGGKLEVIVKKLDRYLSEGHGFDECVDFLKRLEAHSMVQYSLSSYENLIKNGRMPKLVGTLASKLNIRVLGTASEEGTIKIVGPTRGEKKTYRKIMDVMEGDGYRGGMVCIDHVDNESAANALAAEILKKWPTAEIDIMPCGGLCSYYAEESGLIIGYEWL